MLIACTKIFRIIAMPVLKCYRLLLTLCSKETLSAISYKLIFYLGNIEQKHGVSGLEDMDQKMKLKAKTKYYKTDKTGSSKRSCQYVAFESTRRQKEPRGVRGRHARGEAAPAREAHETIFFRFLRVQKIPIG